MVIFSFLFSSFFFFFFFFFFASPCLAQPKVLSVCYHNICANVCSFFIIRADNEIFPEVRNNEDEDGGGGGGSRRRSRTDRCPPTPGHEYSRQRQVENLKLCCTLESFYINYTRFSCRRKKSFVCWLTNKMSVLCLNVVCV